MTVTAGPTVAQPVAVRRISVRGLCAFAARSGDLDLRYRPAPTALEGLRGHQRVAGRRAGSASARSEVTLSLRHGDLEVHGRADGYDASIPRIDEVKTFRGAFERIKAGHRALARAQARTYAHMACVRDGHAAIDVALVWLQIDTDEQHEQVERVAAAELAAGFDALCQAYAAWSAAEAERRVALHATLASVAFPLADFRAGQRTLAEAVYRTHRDARVLLAEAPTGIGKSLGSLFPALKALASQQLDKVYYLCARTSGREPALRAMTQIRRGSGSGASSDGSDGNGSASGMPLRIVELVARDRACLHPDLECHGDSCPLARGFFDRLPAARTDAATALADGDPAAIGRVAGEHGICPYHLQQEMARWADVVVADYNHYFDMTAGLYALMVDEGWKVGVLVDEAHNLVDRARSMYSASLDTAALQAILSDLPAAAARPVRSLVRHLRSLASEPHGDRDRADDRGRGAGRDRSGNPGAGSGAGPGGADYRVIELDSRTLDRIAAATTGLGAIVSDETHRPAQPVLDAFFALNAFEALVARGAAESPAAAGIGHSIVDIEHVDAPRRSRAGTARASVRLTLRNVIPAPFLAARIAAAHGMTLFSATLAPMRFHRDLLDLDAASRERFCRELVVPSPYRSGQIDVAVTAGVSMRHADRDRSLPRVAALIAATCRERGGNHLVYVSSFALLAQLAERVAALAPDLPLWRQRPAMSEADRNAFLLNFREDGHGVGFAVLGGVFGEGVDLPGSRLTGVFIATLGLPQVNPVNEMFRERMQAAFGDGHAYAYLYPGLRKVIQAAGRLIRTPDDCGLVVLIDDRFTQSRVRRLLPAWWPRARHLDAGALVPRRPDAVHFDPGPRHGLTIDQRDGIR